MNSQATPRQAGYQGQIKALLDRTIAGTFLILLSPLLACLAVVIRFQMGSPVLFKQRRTGLHGRPFQVVKFRSMLHATENSGMQLPDEMRITRFGTFLRATSLDELPQLWNVLEGHLSLVGPRPLLLQYLPRYTAEQARRHEVLPGITGWAQVNGRNAISWEEKFALDVWYVDHWSLILDLRIIVLTVKRVLSRSGVSQNGHATMPEFLGSSLSDRDPTK